MSLTKKDLQQISVLIHDGVRSELQEYVVGPLGELMEWKKEMNIWKGEMNEWKGEMNEWKGEINQWKEELRSHIIKSHGEHEEIISLIGYYFEQCAPKQDLKTLGKRVEKLELSNT